MPHNPPSTPCALLLAAGLGSRYREAAGADEDKLLARCQGRDGIERTVLEHAILTLRPSLSRILLVTRPDRPALIALGTAQGCEVLTLPSAGMGDSIAAAVRHARDADGWLIALGDMPFVLPSTVERLVRRFDDETILVPTHRGQRGHPVGFGRVHGPALAGLEGDQGAKRLLRQGRVRELAVEDEGILRDVDTPEALQPPQPADGL